MNESEETSFRTTTILNYFTHPEPYHELFDTNTTAYLKSLLEETNERHHRGLYVQQKLLKELGAGRGGLVKTHFSTWKHCSGFQGDPGVSPTPCLPRRPPTESLDCYPTLIQTRREILW